MNRQEFLRELENHLAGIPKQEREDALEYYQNYFEEAGAENEQSVIEELGSPQKVAQSILENYRAEQNMTYGTSEQERGHNAYAGQTAGGVTGKYKMETGKKVLIVVLLILTFPVWIGLVAGLFGGAVGLLGAVFGVLIAIFGSGIGLLFSGIVCFGTGILCVALNPVKGFTCMGVGALLVSLGILLLWLACMSLCAWLPKLVKAVVKGVKGLFHRREGGNEI